MTVRGRVSRDQRKRLRDRVVGRDRERRPVGFRRPVARRRVSDEEPVEAQKRAVGQSFDYPADTEMLDIPAFLRRQAD